MLEKDDWNETTKKEHRVWNVRYPGQKKRDSMWVSCRTVKEGVKQTLLFNNKEFKFTKEENHSTQESEGDGYEKSTRGLLEELMKEGQTLKREYILTPFPSKANILESPYNMRETDMAIRITTPIKLNALLNLNKVQHMICYPKNQIEVELEGNILFEIKKSLRIFNMTDKIMDVTRLERAFFQLNSFAKMMAYPNCYPIYPINWFVIIFNGESPGLLNAVITEGKYFEKYPHIKFEKLFVIWVQTRSFETYLLEERLMEQSSKKKDQQKTKKLVNKGDKAKSTQDKGKKKGKKQRMEHKEQDEGNFKRVEKTERAHFQEEENKGMENIRDQKIREKYEKDLTDEKARSEMLIRDLQKDLQKEKAYRKLDKKKYDALQKQNKLLLEEKKLVK
jgi:hypothetical protein